MNRRWFAVLVLLAAPPRAARADDGPVCQVRWQQQSGCPGGACPMNLGTGVVVGGQGGRWTVLTAAHVVGDAAGSPVDVEWDGHWAHGQVYRSVKDQEADLAVLVVQDSRPRRKAHLALASPPRGSRVGLAGYPGGRAVPPVGGTLRGPWGPWLTYTARLGSGASGGPVWDEQGNVVAIHWGEDGEAGVGVGTPVETCRRWLQRWGCGPRPAPQTPAPAPAPSPLAPPPFVPDPAPAPPPAPATPPPPAPVPDAGPITVQLTAVDDASTKFVMTVNAPTTRPINVFVTDADGRTQQRTFQPNDQIPVQFTPRRVPLPSPSPSLSHSRP